MALIPNRIVRISMAYKIAVIVAFAVAGCCFFWDLYTHELLVDTQEQLRQSLENKQQILRVIQITTGVCYDGE